MGNKKRYGWRYRSTRIREQPQKQHQQSSISIADELIKLANLKEKGIISEDEFQQMKQDLIRRRKYD